MAKNALLNRFEAAFGVIGVLALVISYFLVTGTNPVPDLLAFLDRAGSLSSPEPEWTTTVGDQPASAIVLDDATIILIRGTVQARGTRTGRELWRASADWSAIAGDGDTAMVLAGRRGHGLEALDPATGSARWRDESAIGAWTFRTAVLTLGCAGSGPCVLASRAPLDGAVRWKLTVPGLGRTNTGANHDVVGTRSPGGAFGDAPATVPAALPALLGLSAERRVEVLDLTAGKRLSAIPAGADARVTIVGGRAVVTTAEPADGGCKFTIEGRNASSGTVVWRRTGYDPHTVTGAGCEQRRAPAGGGGTLAVTRADGRPVLLSAADGREVWVGAADEAVQVADEHSALVRSADRKAVHAVDLATGAVRWTHPLPARAALTLCPAAAIVLDQDIGRAVAYAPGSGKKLLSARLSADVLGCGESGLVLGRGRKVGVVAFTGTP
ncbi:MAG: PQQ-binding-like beta-propeller repeat protein [Dactylosporangium sp.]|nr:PQQ-binding-like beta-propeller repeat protein [Dactylosporangium sp.]NNJ62990.1 PQQ-binding-like beta-propeller repeat protein [Dactylosporangium sp.]